MSDDPDHIPISLKSTISSSTLPSSTTSPSSTLSSSCETIKEIEETKDLDFYKVEGNKAFVSKDFLSACNFYSQALVLDPTNHHLYGNRAAALMQLKRYEDAIQDAQMAIKLNTMWAKGYYRLATAYSYLMNYKKAEINYRKAADLDETEKSNILELAERMKILQTQNPNQQQALHQQQYFHSKKKTLSGFLHGRSLYKEMEDIIETEGNRKEHQLLLRRLKASVSIQSTQNKLDGVFAKLLNPDDFLKIVYPGMSKEKIPSSSPKSFQDILNDLDYKEELEKLMPKVEEKAQSVLRNVKNRGKAVGDEMDSATEEQLWPQILQEAFAREVVTMINRISKRNRANLVNCAKELLIASPLANCASWNQLSNGLLNHLLNPFLQFGYQDGFLGEEWHTLILDDVLRMKTLNKAKNSIHYTMMNYIELDEIKQEYPALAELLEKMQALPFEMNKKNNLGLLTPLKGSCLLRCLSHGEHQESTKDGGRGEQDNGLRFSAFYFINNHESSGGTLQLRSEGKVHEISPQPDRLVIYQSRDVVNQILPVQGTEQFVLSFWMHGKDPGKDLD